jgi:hypothetical protein
VYYFVYLNIINRDWIKPIIILQIIISLTVIASFFVISNWNKILDELLSSPVNLEKKEYVSKVSKTYSFKFPPISYSIVMTFSLFAVMTLEYPIWGTIYSLLYAIFLYEATNLANKLKELFKLYQIDNDKELTKEPREII